MIRKTNEEIKKEIIEQAKKNFDDLFDSRQGGPFLAEISKNFDSSKYYTFLLNAIDDVNVRLATSGVEFAEENIPYQEPLFRSVLRIGIVVHAIKHFKLSFVEYPDWSKVSSPTIDRRDYLNRWDNVLKDFEKRFDKAVDAIAAKIDYWQLSDATQTLLDPDSMNWGSNYRSYGGMVPPWWFGN